MMGKKKECRKLFQTDLRKERSPYMDADPSSWTLADSMIIKGGEELLRAGFVLQPMEQPRMARVDSYRAPPLKLTLETIAEEDKVPDYYLRSKSLPAHRRASLDFSGQGLNRLPSYRPGQGGYLAGVAKSGPILSSSYDYDCAPKHHHHRSRISKMREALRNGRRLRQALSSIFSRIRPASQRSQRSQ